MRRRFASTSGNKKRKTSASSSSGCSDVLGAHVVEPRARGERLS
jgi:hypothetical protein